MNKEEIEKEDKEHLIKVLTEHKDYIFEFDDDNIKIEYILDYIRELEFQNTAFKVEHNHNITRIKNLEQTNKILDTECNRLEQKESILDKVTEYTENYIDDKQNEYEAISESYICQTDEDEYIKEKELAIIKGQKQVLKNVLNIIEGEKK